jgi:hypothetical protein
MSSAMNRRPSLSCALESQAPPSSAIGERKMALSGSSTSWRQRFQRPERIISNRQSLGGRDEGRSDRVG